MHCLDPRPDRLVGQDLSDVFGTDDPYHPPIAAHRRAIAGEVAAFREGWPGGASIFGGRVGRLLGINRHESCQVINIPLRMAGCRPRSVTIR